ncbi:MAG: YIP1 family protein, partial [Acholeplasmataceae bacterium]
MMTRLRRFWTNYILFPKHILFHPFDGYEAFKRFRKGRLSVALVFIALFAFFRIFSYQYEGVLINPNNPLMLNSLEEVFSVVLLVMLFTVGNWSVTTLLEGKGTYR